MRDRQIHCLFLEYRADDHLLNRLTARLGQLLHGRGFHHTELCIPDLRRPGEWINTSIYNGETVSMNNVKTFANPGYVVVTLSVSTEELHEMRTFIERTHAARCRFDGLGMFVCMLPFRAIPWSSGGNSTFCSKYVTDILKAGGIETVQPYQSAIMSPSKLFKQLQADYHGRLVTDSVRYKKDQFAKDAVLSGLFGGLYTGKHESSQQQNRNEAYESVQPLMARDMAAMRNFTIA